MTLDTFFDVGKLHICKPCGWRGDAYGEYRFLGLRILMALNNGEMRNDVRIFRVLIHRIVGGEYFIHKRVLG